MPAAWATSSCRCHRAPLSCSSTTEATIAKSIRQQIADIDTKIASLQVERTKLEEAAKNEVNPEALTAGVVIEFNYGKGTEKRVLQGPIVGVKLADPAVPKSSTMLRVAVGEGFDAQLITVYPAQVTKVIPAAEEAAA
jgi:hypothetical protein